MAVGDGRVRLAAGFRQERFHREPCGPAFDASARAPSDTAIADIPGSYTLVG